jgi:hypothetical protein
MLEQGWHGGLVHLPVTVLDTSNALVENVIKIKSEIFRLIQTNMSVY